VLLSLIIRSADLLLLLLGPRLQLLSLCSRMNLTHRNLAEMTGMTRVTVTKALIRFRQEGRIARQGDDELLRLDR